MWAKLGIGLAGIAIGAAVAATARPRKRRRQRLGAPSTAEIAHYKRTQAARREREAAEVAHVAVLDDYDRRQAALRAKLTPAEHKSVTTYTDSFAFRSINDALRAGKPPPADLVPVVRDLDRAIALSPVDTDLIAYRIVTGRRVDAYAAHTRGELFTDSAFVSTTIDPAYEQSAPLRIRLEIPEGAHAAPVFAGRDTAYERELLLPRNTTFRVLRNEMKTVPDTKHPGQTVDQRQLTLFVEHTPVAAALAGPSRRRGRGVHSAQGWS